MSMKIVDTMCHLVVQCIAWTRRSTVEFITLHHGHKQFSSKAYACIWIAVFSIKNFIFGHACTRGYIELKFLCMVHVFLQSVLITFWNSTHEYRCSSIEVYLIAFSILVDMTNPIRPSIVCVSTVQDNPTDTRVIRVFVSLYPKDRRNVTTNNPFMDSARVYPLDRTDRHTPLMHSFDQSSSSTQLQSVDSSPCVVCVSNVSQKKSRLLLVNYESNTTWSRSSASRPVCKFMSINLLFSPGGSMLQERLTSIVYKRGRSHSLLTINFASATFHVFHTIFSCSTCFSNVPHKNVFIPKHPQNHIDTRLSWHRQLFIEER